LRPAEDADTGGGALWYKGLAMGVCDLLRFMHELGARVIAVSDVQGGVYHNSGLDIPKLLKPSAREETIGGFPEAEAITMPTSSPCPVTFCACSAGTPDHRR